MAGDVLIRCLAVGAGGALGSLGRYGLSLWGASLGTRIPYGTLAANALGCLLMGAVMQVVVVRSSMPEAWRLFLAVGLLGGLTTFSTFSYESVALARQGHPGPALLYVLGSLAVGLVGAAAGWWVVSLVPGRG